MNDPDPFEPFERLSSRPIYGSPWCRLRLDRIRLPDGATQDYHIFDVPAAVVVVPALPDGSIVMLWQYRYPHGETHFEVPAGRIDVGETPAEGAARELLEETGYRPGKLERMAGFYPINGISPHYAHIFRALHCERVREPSHEPSERMSVHTLGEREVRERLLRGDFADGFTSLALFHHFAREDAPRKKAPRG
ncbi:MAG TPA: NUDIX hydrolase [Planctomycetes bacterium]|nr:NUDIX hydrolase [Planctomycetota bacterium]